MTRFMYFVHASLQDILADDFDEELTVIDLLESVISNSANQKEAISKHIQSILLVKHLQPVSGTSQFTKSYITVKDSFTSRFIHDHSTSPATNDPEVTARYQNCLST